MSSSVCHMKCAVCNISINLMTCSGCKQVAYCSKQHQKDDWKAHKINCANSIKHSSSSTTDSTYSSNEVRSCRCMFCGNVIVASSEDDAIRHMEVCSALQEQLNASKEQFTIPSEFRDKYSIHKPNHTHTED